MARIHVITDAALQQCWQDTGGVDENGNPLPPHTVEVSFTAEEEEAADADAAAEYAAQAAQAAADADLRAAIATHPDPIVVELARRAGLWTA